jgi:hypothetical protein
VLQEDRPQRNGPEPDFWTVFEAADSPIGCRSGFTMSQTYLQHFQLLVKLGDTAGAFHVIERVRGELLLPLWKTETAPYGTQPTAALRGMSSAAAQWACGPSHLSLRKRAGRWATQSYKLPAMRIDTEDPKFDGSLPKLPAIGAKSEGGN